MRRVYRMSKIGDAMPKTWSYGDPAEHGTAPEAQVWYQAYQVAACAMGEEISATWIDTLDETLATGAGNTQTLAVMTAAQIKEQTMTNYTYGGYLYRTAADAVRACLYDYVTACGENAAEHALNCLAEVSVDALVDAHARGETILDGEWSMPDYADDWDIERGYEAARLVLHQERVEGMGEKALVGEIRAACASRDFALAWTVHEILEGGHRPELVSQMSAYITTARREVAPRTRR